MTHHEFWLRNGIGKRCLWKKAFHFCVNIKFHNFSHAKTSVSKFPLIQCQYMLSANYPILIIHEDSNNGNHDPREMDIVIGDDPGGAHEDAVVEADQGDDGNDASS